MMIRSPSETTTAAGGRFITAAAAPRRAPDHIALTLFIAVLFAQAFPGANAQQQAEQPVDCQDTVVASPVTSQGGFVARNCTFAGAVTVNVTDPGVNVTVVDCTFRGALNFLTSTAVVSSAMSPALAIEIGNSSVMQMSIEQPIGTPWPGAGLDGSRGVVALHITNRTSTGQLKLLKESLGIQVLVDGASSLGGGILWTGGDGPRSTTTDGNGPRSRVHEHYHRIENFKLEATGGATVNYFAPCPVQVVRLNTDRNGITWYNRFNVQIGGFSVHVGGGAHIIPGFILGQSCEPVFTTQATRRWTVHGPWTVGPSRGLDLHRFTLAPAPGPAGTPPPTELALGWSVGPLTLSSCTVHGPVALRNIGDLGPVRIVDTAIRSNFTLVNCTGRQAISLDTASAVHGALLLDDLVIGNQVTVSAAVQGPLASVTLNRLDVPTIVLGGDDWRDLEVGIVDTTTSGLRLLGSFGSATRVGLVNVTTPLLSTGFHVSDTAELCIANSAIGTLGNYDGTERDQEIDCFGMRQTRCNYFYVDWRNLQVRLVANTSIGQLLFRQQPKEKWKVSEGKYQHYKVFRLNLLGNLRLDVDASSSVASGLVVVPFQKTGRSHLQLEPGAVCGGSWTLDKATVNATDYVVRLVSGISLTAVTWLGPLMITGHPDTENTGAVTLADVVTTALVMIRVRVPSIRVAGTQTMSVVMQHCEVWQATVDITLGRIPLLYMLNTTMGPLRVAEAPSITSIRVIDSFLGSVTLPFGYPPTDHVLIRGTTITGDLNIASTRPSTADILFRVENSTLTAIKALPLQPAVGAGWDNCEGQNTRCTPVTANYGGYQFQLVNTTLSRPFAFSSDVKWPQGSAGGKAQYWMAAVSFTSRPASIVLQNTTLPQLSVLRYMRGAPTPQQLRIVVDATSHCTSAGLQTRGLAPPGSIVLIENSTDQPSTCLPSTDETRDISVGIESPMAAEALSLVDNRTFPVAAWVSTAAEDAGQRVASWLAARRMLSKRDVGRGGGAACVNWTLVPIPSDDDDTDVEKTPTATRTATLSIPTASPTITVVPTLTSSQTATPPMTTTEGPTTTTAPGTTAVSSAPPSDTPNSTAVVITTAAREPSKSQSPSPTAVPAALPIKPKLTTLDEVTDVGGKTAAAATVVTNAMSFRGVGAGSVARAGRVQSVSGLLAQCRGVDPSPEDLADPDPVELPFPLPLSLGASRVPGVDASRLTGAIVIATALCVGGALLPVLLWHQGVQVRTKTVTSVVAALGTVLPSYFAPNVVAAAGAFVRGGEPDTTLWVVLILCMALCAASASMYAVVGALAPRYTAPHIAGQDGDTFTGELRDGSRPFAPYLGPCVDGCRDFRRPLHRQYAAVDVWCAILIGACMALPGKSCRIRVYAAAAIALLYLVYLFAVRPYRSPVEMAFVAGAGLLQFLAAATLVVLVVTASDQTPTVEEEDGEARGDEEAEDPLENLAGWFIAGTMLLLVLQPLVLVVMEAVAKFALDEGSSAWRKTRRLLGVVEGEKRGTGADDANGADVELLQMPSSTAVHQQQLDNPLRAADANGGSSRGSGRVSKDDDRQSPAARGKASPRNPLLKDRDASL